MVFHYNPAGAHWWPHKRRKHRVKTRYMINGKKNNLTKRDFVHYLGEEILHLNTPSIEKTLIALKDAEPLWQELIYRSFLNPLMKEQYKNLLQARLHTLQLGSSKFF